MISPRFVAGAVLTVALLLSACTLRQPEPARPPDGQGAEKPRNTKLVVPLESALTALQLMNESASHKEFAAAEEHFREFRSHWAVIRPALQAVDPRLDAHLEDGAVELDLEFKRPQSEIRVYEFAEESVKLGRLLGKVSELLNVPIRAELVPLDPVADLPFNSERRITISLSEHKYEPARIEVDQHTRVTFVLVNRGKETHEFDLGHYGVEVEEINPGETREITLVVLDAGEFEFACHEPGHYEVGMIGSLKVKPAVLKQP